ncbi:MAG TPA: MFS transporter, partial [Casimicrobiaceae bacterium]|nr:MFS transporter [Casimicrobiaceae bacterium]
EAGGERAMGGTILAGLRLIRDTPLLQAMCVVMFFGVGVGTLLYNEQAAIARASFADAAARTAFYARIDLAINVLTIVVQVGITRWLLVRHGVAPALLIPAFAVLLGFCVLSASPLPVVVALVQIATRAGEFALGKPARESIYTRVDREMRYKAKGFIDTVVYRGGDLTFVWLHKGMTVLGLGSNVVFGAGVLVALGFVGGALWLVRLAPDAPAPIPQDPAA